MRKNSQNASYLISLDTLALEPFRTENGMGTRIIEKGEIFTIPQKPIHSIRKSCSHYGHSFKSAVNSAKQFLENRHKVPIVLAYDFGKPLVFIPTMSPTSDHTIWIALHAIANIEPHEMGCIVHLKNNYSIIVNVSESTIFRQHSLGTILETEYKKRYKQLNGAPGGPYRPD